MCLSWSIPGWGIRWVLFETILNQSCIHTVVTRPRRTFHREKKSAASVELARVEMWNLLALRCDRKLPSELLGTSWTRVAAPATKKEHKFGRFVARLISFTCPEPCAATLP